MKKQYDFGDFDLFVNWMYNFDWDRHKYILVDFMLHKQICRTLEREGILKYVGTEGTEEKYEINI